METMLGISLHNYLDLKLAKMLCRSFISWALSSTKLELNKAEQYLLRSEGGQKQADSWGENAPNNVYT
jgi:hypothetical protein